MKETWLLWLVFISDDLSSQLIFFGEEMKNIFTKLSVNLSNIYLVSICSHHLIAFWINITTFHEICAQIYLLQKKEMATHSSILA